MTDFGPPAACLVDKLPSFHKGICSKLFCAARDNGAILIVPDFLPSWTMFRGAISQASWQPCSNPRMGWTADPLQLWLPQCVKRERGRGVCECVHAPQQGCTELCWPGCPCCMQPKSRPHCWHSATWCVIFLSTHHSIYPSPVEPSTFQWASLTSAVYNTAHMQGYMC